MRCAVQVENLKKSYGNHEVLKGLNFSVREGEIFALLGVNGAGKTTALECIEGLLKYDSGKITVNGKMGIQLQSSSLPEHIKPLEAIKLFAKWNKTDVDFSVISALGIEELAKTSYCGLSTGQKRRLHLALALITRPDIIFLDEPTAGLDVEGRISLHGQIRKLKEQGKTIILASHDMAEVESLCSRIAVLREGIIIFEGTVDELTAKVSKRYNIRIITEKGEENYESEDVGETLLHLLWRYQADNISVLDIRVDRGNLEQHFIDITNGGGK